MQVTLASRGGRLAAETSARQKILMAAQELFVTQGYRRTTTKMIAETAGVNEVTLFRQFGSKIGIVEALVQARVPLVDRVISFIQSEATWDLETDLTRLAELQIEYVSKNLDLVMALLHERGEDQEVQRIVSLLPNRLKTALMGYFSEMQRRGRMIETDPERAAVFLMAPLFGYAMMKHMFGDLITALPPKEHIQNTIRLFARAVGAAD
jgi:AcrR family transcriptional regulator